MNVLTPKLPSDIVAYEIDFAPQLGCDAVRTFTAMVTSGTVVLEKSESTGQGVRILVSGGATGENAALSIAVTSVGEQEFTQTASLAIRSGAVSVVPQTTTKRQVVEMAFEYMSIAGYEFDHTPEELASALRGLDTLMARMQGPGVGLALGYNAPAAIGGGDLDEPVGVPDAAVQWAALALADDRCAGVGKTLAPRTVKLLRDARDAVNAQFTVVPDRSLTRQTPRGAGNKPWSTWSPYNTPGRC